MPVNWVDGVTPVNAANLETMEADTAAKQATTEKAQANGYAPLDGTAKVPLVHLPPVSGVDYIGTWGSGIAYKRGDVVRYGSNDYLAVNDSTGVAPPAAYAPPLGGVSMGTSFPASPYDGQEFVLVDSLTAPTYSWRFRYGAGITDAYKWVFIGGSSAVATVATFEPSGSGAIWRELATVGPTLTVPRSGIYILDGWVQVIGAVAVPDTPSFGIADNGAINPVVSAATECGRASCQISMTCIGQRTLTAGWVPRMRYLSYQACQYGNRRLGMTPVRVA